ncbi:MAG TPA: L-threonylcarbamoyladenylate synthase [Rhizomicrobium sp.]|nr:L-threonylcarbamoyladenylate synthase [Rhizomicrobium sp.]
MTTTLSNLRKADAASVAAAAAILRRGGLVAFPTETVYGLGADATNGEAVAGIFAAKRRPRFNPLIVHVRDRAQAETFAEFSDETRALAGAFWPGALTLVLPRRADSALSLLVSAGLDTVALRAPSHALARQLILETAKPIAAPSANASGRVSPTTAAHVAEELGDAVDLILDGGPALLGIESTVIGFEHGRAVLLRPGAVAREEIEKITGPLAAPSSAAITAPGQLESHYAPRASLRLDSREPEPGEAWLAFGSVPGAMNLSPAGDLKEAASNLFAMLRRLDAQGATRIAVAPIPEHGIGEAINDRLRRAAAPRP